MADPPPVVRADGENGSAEWEALLSSTKSWTDGYEHPQRRDYTAVSLYTADAGYWQVYQVINEALRRGDIVNDDPLLRSAAFLVELLNIDLFNLLARDAGKADFEGTVCRGMCVSAQELASFRDVARGPIPERYIAIPLSMASATRRRRRKASHSCGAPCTGCSASAVCSSYRIRPRTDNRSRSIFYGRPGLRRLVRHRWGDAVNEFERAVRDFRRSFGENRQIFREIGAEHSSNSLAADIARRTHAELHAELEGIPIQQATRHMAVEEFAAALGKRIFLRVFSHERVRAEPHLNRLAEHVIQTGIRRHHMKTITEWWQFRQFVESHRLPDLSLDPSAGGPPPHPDLTDGPTVSDQDAPPSHDQYRAWMRKQFEQWKRDQGRNGTPNPQQDQPVPTARPLASKALLITVPLAVLLQFVPPNGASVQIPGVVRFVAGLVIAALGSPRFRSVAVGCTVIVAIFVVIVTVWSNHLIGHH